MRTPTPIWTGDNQDRMAITGVIRGTESDGLAVTGSPTCIYVSQHPDRLGLSGGRDDMFEPTDEREYDPITGRAITVYRFVGFAPLPTWGRRT